MKTMVFMAGTTIDLAARALAKNAPACGDFNGIPLRARYATTRASDVVARFHRIQQESSVIWRASPEGKRVAAEDAAHLATCQAAADAAMERLLAGGPDGVRLHVDGGFQSFLIDNCPAVLAYGEQKDERLNAAMHAWLTGAGDAESIAMLKTYAREHGYQGPGALGVGDFAAVLEWCAGFVDAADRVGVRVDKARVLAVFEAHGWGTNVNTGEAFDGTDPENFARYIVGQMLDGYARAGCVSVGVLLKFVADWRSRFASSAAP